MERSKASDQARALAVETGGPVVYGCPGYGRGGFQVPFDPAGHPEERVFIVFPGSGDQTRRYDALVLALYRRFWQRRLECLSRGWKDRAASFEMYANHVRLRGGVLLTKFDTAREVEERVRKEHTMRMSAYAAGG